MINFKANLINTATVQKYNSKDYKDSKVSFVELNPNSMYDRKAVREVNNSWVEGMTLVADISDSFHLCKDLYEDEYTARFYALTQQREGFDNLNPDDILGMTMIQADVNGDLEIEYLQADPFNNYFSAAERSIKGIGRAIINSIKELYPDKKILLTSVESAIDFYKKLGFSGEGSFLALKR